jgi:hypothetical protein
MNKRGRLRVFDSFEPSETALIVMNAGSFRPSIGG